MLERTSEQLIEALASLEGLEIKDRSLLLDAKAQGLGLLSLVNSVMNAPEDQPLPSREFLDHVREIIGEYVSLVDLLQDEGLKH